MIKSIFITFGTILLILGFFTTLMPESSVTSYEKLGDLLSLFNFNFNVAENPNEYWAYLKPKTMLGMPGATLIWIHHHLGILDVADANSSGEMVNTAKNIGIVHSILGILLIVGGIFMHAKGKHKKDQETSWEDRWGEIKGKAERARQETEYRLLKDKIKKKKDGENNS